MREKIKYEEHLTWITPEIHIEINGKYDELDITVSKDDMEIEFNWDNGYMGRGSAIFYIPNSILEKALNKIKEVKHESI